MTTRDGCSLMVQCPKAPSWLGPLSFLVLIDDLDVDCLIHKYVDDTTLTEPLCVQHQPTNVELFFHQLQIWANNNDMVVNLNTTKEMFMGPPSKTSHLPLQLSAGHIERVSSVKLLGINLDAYFSWKSHVETIMSKATQRLYFLKQPRRAGVPPAQLLYFYTGVIRPVLEYMRPRFGITCSRKLKLTKLKLYKGELWGSSTVTLMTCLTLALCIVLPFQPSPTDENSSHASFLKSILEPSSCLSSHLPNPWDPSITTRLRSANKFPRLPSRTRKYHGMADPNREL